MSGRAGELVPGGTTPVAPLAAVSAVTGAEPLAAGTSVLVHLVVRPGGAATTSTGQHPAVDDDDGVLTRWRAVRVGLRW